MLEEIVDLQAISTNDTRVKTKDKPNLTRNMYLKCLTIILLLIIHQKKRRKEKGRGERDGERDRERDILKGPILSEGRTRQEAWHTPKACTQIFSLLCSDLVKI